MKRVVRSFGFAGRGILDALATEQNFKLHWLAGTAVLVITGALPWSGDTQRTLATWVGVVLGLELFNSAIESTVDLATQQQHPLAKKAKDCAAGAVLVAAGCAAAVFWDAGWELVGNRLHTQEARHAAMLRAGLGVLLSCGSVAVSLYTRRHWLIRGLAVAGCLIPYLLLPSAVGPEFSFRSAPDQPWLVLSQLMIIAAAASSWSRRERPSRPSE